MAAGEEISCDDWQDDWRNSRVKIADSRPGKWHNPLLPIDMLAEVAHQLSPLYKEFKFQKFESQFMSRRLEHHEMVMS
jgi:hypothetical protein